MTEVEASLVRAMDAQGVVDRLIRNGIMAVASAEGGLGRMVPEVGYAHTSNDRIRQVFGERVRLLSDDAINRLKADDRTWFNFVYSGGNSVGHSLGNRPGTDDGYNFRGRGPMQLTGRGGYARYGAMTGHDLTTNPDLAGDPDVGAAVTVAYILDRYHGGGFYQLMACVGNSTGDIAERKAEAFYGFMAHHTYDAAPGLTASYRSGSVGPVVRQIQTAVGTDVDGRFGQLTAHAVERFQADRGIPATGVVDARTLSAMGIT